jgi:hypothetical protein
MLDMVGRFRPDDEWSRGTPSDPGAAIHTTDAQLVTGTLQPVPTVSHSTASPKLIGLNHGTAGPWPHNPARIGPHTTECEHGWST